MPAINEDVIAFLRSRPIAMLCTRDRENHPDAHESFIAEVTTDRVICLVPEHLAGRLPQNALDNGDAALLISRSPGDHRSVQLKGKITDLEQARFRAEFAPAVEPLLPMFTAYMPHGAARAMLDRMTRQPVFRVQLDVTQVFDQTPGPQAGRPIAGGAE